MKTALDDELAKRYGAYASFSTDVDPYLVENWGESAADEVDRLLKQYCRTHMTVLDLGCGAGQTLCRLAGKVQHIFGFEQDVNLLAAAQQRVNRMELDNVTLVEGNVAEPADLTPLPDDSFSICLSRRGPDVNPSLMPKLKANAFVIQELYQEPLGLREIFGRKAFLPSAGSNPHWLVDRYRWLGLMPVSIKDYFFEEYFETAEKFSTYLQHAGPLSDWRMPQAPFDPKYDQAALNLYIQFNSTEKGIRLFSHRKVYVFRRTAVSHYPAIPEAKPLYV